MRRLSLALIAAVSTVAFTQIAPAADLPVKAPAKMLSPPVLNWAGFYGGINGGYGWDDPGDILINETVNGTYFHGPTNFGSIRMDGGFIGGQLGYNWQFNNVVAGLEGDIQFSGIEGNLDASRTYLGGGNPTQTLSASGKLDWFATIRGRLGWLVTPAVLLYGTGGVAFGDTQYNWAWNDSVGFRATGTASNKKTGWVAGGGVEWMFMPRWSVKVEYQYLDFGSVNPATMPELFGAGGAPTAYAITPSGLKSKFNTVRAGLNYHF